MQLSMKMNLKNSLILSVIFHVLIIILFSIARNTDPFKDLQEPIVVEMESDSEAMSDGISDNLDEAQHSQAPVHNEQLKKEESTLVVPEKALPKQQDIKLKDDSSISDNLKKPNQTEIKKDLNDIKKDVEPKINTDQLQMNKVDEKMEEYLNQEEANNIKNEESTKMNDDIEKILNEDVNQNNVSKITDNDPLKGADWSAAPRKTLSFPDIASKIPEEYKKKGRNYSVTMRITFDKNGLAIRAQVILTSGDPRIDAIFKKELRKIKVESISRDRVDEVTKKFTISTK